VTEPAKRPWWLLPIFGPIPPLEPKQISLLGAVALALLFEEYDLAMLTAALPQIAESLNMAETDFGFYLGTIRLGALPALALVPYADRIGRRKVFLVTVAGTALTTLLTGFSQTPTQFVICQMLTRTFFTAGSAISIVMISEEFPANHRGWGIGMLGALGASGHGIAMILFANIDRLPYGWRTLYLIGVVPLLVLPILRRKVPETERFRRFESSQENDIGGYSLAPLFNLARQYPTRILGVSISAFLPAVGLVGAFQFTGYYTQTVHGWTAGQYSAMVIFGGILGIAGNIVAGHLADRFGRKLVGMTLLGSFPFWVALFYNGPGWSITIAWIGFLFCSQGGRIILRTLATELFPTDQRASASGLYTILEAIGGAVGMYVLYFASSEAGDFVGLITILAFSTLVGGAVLLFYPETKQQELESISR
jgi:putative MFS transporter